MTWCWDEKLAPWFAIRICSRQNLFMTKDDILLEAEMAMEKSLDFMAMRDPALMQSRARYEQARKEFRDRLRDALLKADPSVQPILEKARRQQHRDR